MRLVNICVFLIKFKAGYLPKINEGKQLSAIELILIPERIKHLDSTGQETKEENPTAFLKSNQEITIKSSSKLKFNSWGKINKARSYRTISEKQIENMCKIKFNFIEDPWIKFIFE
jgi:hypothetical protein